MDGRKDKKSGGDCNKKLRTTNSVWRPVGTQASSHEEECSVKEVIDKLESETQVQEVHLCTSAQNAIEVAATNSTASSSASQNKEEHKVGESVDSTEKHSISVEVGVSLLRFIRGKGGSTQKEIEDEMGVKIIIPLSKDEDLIIIEGVSVERVSRASEKIQTIIDEAVKSPNLDYSHFISLPLAIHPELVDKLVNFQNSILGISDSCINENLDGDSNEDNSENEDVIIDAYTEAGLVLETDANQKLKKEANEKGSVLDARGIFEQYGSEEWGEYLIREAHL